MLLFSPRMICFWPGLPAAFRRGDAQSLLMAVGFSWVCCLLLLATFIWTDWLSTSVTGLAWLVAIAFWIWETIRNLLSWRRLTTDSAARANDDRFSAAQDEYLRGNWFEAEALLLAILADHPRDAESHLLLIGVLRHSRRWKPALRRLDRLELLETASGWRFEISRERQLVKARMAEQSGEDGPEEQERQEDQESTDSA